MSTSDATLPPDLRTALVDLILAAADDDFLIGHAASEWTGLAPMLEEDIAVSSIAQDEIAHAREWYGVVAGLTGRSADDIAYGRTPAEYRCAAITLKPDDFDWANLIARQFYYDHFDSLRLERFAASTFAPLAPLAKRILAEEKFHLHHMDNWIARLAGDADARKRIQSALDQWWLAAVQQFEEIADVDKLIASGLYPAPPTPMFERFRADVSAAITRAGLNPPGGNADPARLPPAGRRGVPAPRLAEVLNELCEVYRIEPAARW